MAVRSQVSPIPASHSALPNTHTDTRSLRADDDDLLFHSQSSSPETHSSPPVIVLLLVTGSPSLEQTVHALSSSF